jgi:hypothetical protein
MSHSILHRWSLIPAAALLMSGCGESVSGPEPVAAVEISMPAASVVAGGTVQLSVEVRDANGNLLPDRSVDWTSSNESVATVDDTGLVTAIAPGTVTIHAIAEGQRGEVLLTVQPVPVASITVAPAAVTLEVGETEQLEATVRDAAGSVLSGRVIDWSSSAAGVASVSSQGVVTAVASGEATITATSEGHSATALITIAVAGEITISPRESAVTLKQADQRSIIIDFETNEGVTGPVELFVEGVPSGMTGTISSVGSSSGLLTINSATFGLDTHAPAAGTYAVRVRARADGADDALATITVTIQTPLVFQGGFTIGNMLISRQNVGQNECQWNISIQGTATATYPDITTNATNVIVRVTGTIWGTPVQQQVGNTTCSPNTIPFDHTSSVVSMFPSVGAAVKNPNSPFEFFVSATSTTPVAAGASGTIYARYVCESATCSGQSENATLMLLVQ